MSTLECLLAKAKLCEGCGSYAHEHALKTQLLHSDGNNAQSVARSDTPGLWLLS